MARPKPEKEKEIVQMVSGAYKSSRDDKFRRYKEEVWNRCYKNWRGILDYTIPHKSNMFIPETFKTIETMVAREMSAIFNDSGIFYDFMPRKKSDAESSKTVSAFCNYDFSRIPHVYRKMRKWLTQLHVYGTSIIKVYWDFEYNIDKSGYMNVNRDQFNFDVIPSRNFFIDPVANNLDEAKWVVTRSHMDLDTFKEMIDRLEFSKLKEDDINQIASSGSTLQYDWDEIDIIDSLTVDPNRKFIEILEYWNKEKDRFIVVAGDKFVVRDTEIPFKHKRFPFVCVVDIPDPEHFWGISTSEIISDLQSEINAYRNNRMDKANFLMNPMFMVRQGSLLDRKELVSRPGGLVRLRNMDDLAPLPMGDMNQSDYIEEQNIKNDAQTASGITDYSLGSAGGNFNETATGISILSSNADARIITKVQYIQEEGLKPLAYMWLSLQQQFGKKEEVFYVTGKEWTLDSQMLFNSYDIKAIASTQMVNKQVRQNQVMQLSQIVYNNPTVDQKEWMKVILESFGFNANRLLVDAPQTPAPQPGMQAAQQANPDQVQPNEIGTATGYDFIQGAPTNG